jgi:hypothetical protein
LPSNYGDKDDRVTNRPAFEQIIQIDRLQKRQVYDTNGATMILTSFSALIGTWAREFET